MHKLQGEKKACNVYKHPCQPILTSLLVTHKALSLRRGRQGGGEGAGGTNLYILLRAAVYPFIRMNKRVILQQPPDFDGKSNLGGKNGTKRPRCRNILCSLSSACVTLSIAALQSLALPDLATQMFAQQHRRTLRARTHTHRCALFVIQLHYPQLKHKRSLLSDLTYNS